MEASGRLCEDDHLAAAGMAARRAGPPVVAASSIGSWVWCPLKAWHATTLFNAGWLGGELEERVARGLGLLWAAELAKTSMYRIVHGRILHGEQVDPGELVAAAEAARMLAREPVEALEKLRGRIVPGHLGLIDPRAYERQLQRYREAWDLEEYHRLEDWPLVARSSRGLTVIGIPDSIQRSRGGYRVVELKTTSKPWLARRRGRSYQAAKLQLAAYAWILVERWPVEEAVLVFEAQDGRLVLRERHDAVSLAEWFEENGLPIAERLASPEPPGPHPRAPCGSCEYGGRWPGGGGG